jgi:hypothetical protein
VVSELRAGGCTDHLLNGYSIYPIAINTDEILAATSHDVGLDTCCGTQML